MQGSALPGKRQRYGIAASLLPQTRSRDAIERLLTWAPAEGGGTATLRLQQGGEPDVARTARESVSDRGFRTAA